MASPVMAQGRIAPDYLNMIMSLLVVIGVIFGLAMLAKRFNLGIAGQGAIKLVATLPVGTKERLIVVEIEQQQYLIGVTAGEIRLIDKLTNNIAPTMNKTSQSAGINLDSLTRLLKKGKS
ncbi:MAG: flagellar biosynthetic protein FliO [Gammaproteobacteria bacterium]|nr:flagellar biosynthetic protein FliO [Gammaproteobacteria bacterium]